MEYRFRLRAALALTSLLAPSARAQNVAYLTTLGTDTLALEQYQRRGTTITGDYVSAFGGILVHHYVIQLGPNDRVEQLAMTVGRRGGRPTDTLGFIRAGDTAILSSNRWPLRVRRMRAPGFFPMFVGLNALEEAAVTFARSRPRDSLTIPIFAVWANFDTAHFRVLMYSRDSVGLWSRITPGLLKLDAQGHVLRASARLTTTRTETVRVPAFDMIATLGSMRDAPADAAVSEFASLSPRDSFATTLGEAHLRIAYGRPALRGRDVFSNGVLGDTIWRTGANGPTEFITDRAIQVADKLLPAGRYALWTRAGTADTSFALRFSSQVTRECMDYHPEYDVLEAPLHIDRLPRSVDRLTLQIRPNGRTSRFEIEWGSRRLWLPISMP